MNNYYKSRAKWAAKVRKFYSRHAGKYALKLMQPNLDLFDLIVKPASFYAKHFLVSVSLPYYQRHAEFVFVK